MSYKIDGVPIFDGLYIITKDGKLYSCRSGKYLSPDTDRYGYIYYVISILGKRYTLKAHRLVAQAWFVLAGISHYAKMTIEIKKAVN